MNIFTEYEDPATFRSGMGQPRPQIDKSLCMRRGPGSQKKKMGDEVDLPSLQPHYCERRGVEPRSLLVQAEQSLGEALDVEKVDIFLRISRMKGLSRELSTKVL